MTLRAEYAVAAGVAVVLALALILALCSGCTTSARLTPLGYGQVETRHTAGTQQRCGWSSELARVVDRAAGCLTGALREAGHGDPRFREDPVWACLIEQPEVCDSPHQRKRGCSISSGQFWVARWWPPVCSSDWPRETICVQSHAEQRDNWRADAAHEVAEVALARVGLYGQGHALWALEMQGRCR